MEFIAWLSARIQSMNQNPYPASRAPLSYDRLWPVSRAARAIERLLFHRDQTGEGEHL